MPYGTMTGDTVAALSSADIYVWESTKLDSLTLSVICDGALDEEFQFESDSHYTDVADAVFDWIASHNDIHGLDSFSVHISDADGEDLYFRSFMDGKEHNA